MYIKWEKNELLNNNNNLNIKDHQVYRLEKTLNWIWIAATKLQLILCFRVGFRRYTILLW